MSHHLEYSGERPFGVLYMGRSCTDLYNNDIGAAFEKVITSCFTGGYDSILHKRFSA